LPQASPHFLGKSDDGLTHLVLQTGKAHGNNIENRPFTALESFRGDFFKGGADQEIS